VEGSYVDTVLAELDSFASSGYTPGPLYSIYIGGGTPSLFSPRAIGRLIEGVKAAFEPAQECEVTVEANPDSLDGAKCEEYLKAGANRLSIGVQSLNDEELKTLGRVHTAERALSAFKTARKAGFANIGADLIFGVPGQSVGSFSSSLSGLLSLGPEHISVYGLTYEESTPMTGIREAGGFAGLLPTDETEERMYALAQKALKEGGYGHYELSNWARPGLESRHNSRYWLGGDYLGLGSGAHSYMGSGPWGVRWWNEADVERYCAFVRQSGSARAFTEKLTRRDAIVEAMMLGLRMPQKGLLAAPFAFRFGLSPLEAFPRAIELASRGLMRMEGGDLLLTEKGLLLSDSIFTELLTDAD